MTTTADTKVVLPEAPELQALRDVLKAAAKRIQGEATSIAPAADAMWRERWDAMSAGRLVEAIANAETALFEVLSVAKCYMHCSASEAALDGTRDAS